MSVDMMGEYERRGSSKQESSWGNQLREKMLSYSNQDGPKAKKQKTGYDDVTNVSIMFSSKDSVDALASASKLIKNHKLKLIQIESRPSQSDAAILEYLVTVAKTGELTNQFVDLLKKEMDNVKVLKEQTVPWFPKTLDELNPCLGRGLYSELEPSHPGYNDPVYQERRKACAEIALNYTFGKPIPTIEYTQEETETWRAIITNLKKHHPTNACKEFNEIFPDLCKECDVRDDNIPQMEDVSNFIKKRTGFRLRPVSALLSSRDFLSALAFRVFPATQYLRHSSSPFYTPEPDLCHELLGHAALLANPDFAEFSQEIGLASLGAPDEYIDKLSTVYWFTVEFGVCQEPSGMKAYGAGLLGSVGEIQYFLTGKAETKPFDPYIAQDAPYPVDGFQTLYFVASSFLDALQKFRAFAAKIPRPFCVRYNPYNCSIEVLDSKEKLQQYTSNLKGELNILMDAVNKLK
ncbi:phenylalanine-4-hydroxylase-like [Amphiura filiformis]|uniref:phenylalanine-4-hydroxylase-like n=1 Tax=Amphiura filiformis TaxID=82378 RepID=UPI003B21E95A